MARATITIEIKEPDALHEMVIDLGVDDEASREFIEFGEYASIELLVDENFKIVGGHFLKVKRG